MGFKVFPGDAKVSSEGHKGLPPKGAQVSPRRERSEDLPSKGSKALPPRNAKISSTVLLRGGGIPYYEI